MIHEKEEKIKHLWNLHLKERFHEQDPNKFELDGFTYKLRFFEYFMQEIPFENAIAFVKLQQLTFESVKEKESKALIEFTFEYLLFNWKQFQKGNFNLKQWEYTVKVAIENLQIATGNLKNAK